MAVLRLIILSTLCTLAVARVFVRREIPHTKFLAYPEYSENTLEHHHPVHYELPPAISTISFITSHNSKPVSFSGFTNHGRGHHDPGYSVEFRQDGFALPPVHHHLKVPVAEVQEIPHEIDGHAYY